MNQQPPPFEGLFVAFKRFVSLVMSVLAGSRPARPFHCTVGQELLRPDRMPEFCFCIVAEGVFSTMIQVCDDPSHWLIRSPGTWWVGQV